MSRNEKVDPKVDFLLLKFLSLKESLLFTQAKLLNNPRLAVFTAALFKLLAALTRAQVVSTNIFKRVHALGFIAQHRFIRCHSHF